MTASITSSTHQALILQTREKLLSEMRRELHISTESHIVSIPRHCSLSHRALNVWCMGVCTSYPAGLISRTSLPHSYCSKGMCCGQKVMEAVMHDEELTAIREGKPIPAPSRRCTAAWRITQSD